MSSSMRDMPVILKPGEIEEKITEEDNEKPQSASPLKIFPRDVVNNKFVPFKPAGA